MLVLHKDPPHSPYPDFEEASTSRFYLDAELIINTH